jgi:2-methylcitrate dehydratase PrpD
MKTDVDRPLLARLASFAVAGPNGDAEAAVIADARRRVRDVVGVSLAALDSEPAQTVGGLIDARGGNSQAGCLGRFGRLPTASAALWGGTLAHALDYDDTHLPSVLHPSASVVPAALAAAEANGASGAALLRAVAVGDEICIRLGMAGYDPELRNSVFFEKGFHATAICGTVGAAAAAALASAADEAEIAHAMAIAASMGSGLLEANRTGGSVKRVHCGWAAHAGVTAAELAALGLTGPPTALEGRFGLLRAFCGDRVDLGVVNRGLGTAWELLRLHFKPYPTNHFTHAAIDAALELREQGIRADDVEDVEIGVAAPALRTIGEPADQKARPANGYAAKFSGPYTFAAALVGGGGLGVDLDDFPDGELHDGMRLALARRVRCVADPACDELFPNVLAAIVRLRTAGGERREVPVLSNRGGPERPLSDEELDRKFQHNAARSLPPDQVARLDGLLSALDRLEDVGEIAAATVPEAR